MNVLGDECLRWWTSRWWMSDNRPWLPWWPWQSLTDAEGFADWCWLICWLMLLDMLIDADWYADWCWLVLTKANFYAYWVLTDVDCCWLMLITPYDDSLVSAINADLIIMAMIWLFGNYLLRSCSSSDDKLLSLLILLYWYSVNILAIIWWLFYVTAHGQVDHVLIIYQYSGNHLMIICCSCWSSNNDHQMVMRW